MIKSCSASHQTQSEGKLFYADGGETKLTLLIAVDICRNSEITGQLMQNVTVSVDLSNVEQVPIHAMKSTQRKVKPKYSDDKATTQQGKCKYCGQTHKACQCPAYGNTCDLCGMKNHPSSGCLQNH